VVGGRDALGDSVALHFVNTGSAPAYLPRCGSEPLMLTQQFVNGVWTGGVQNFMCVAPAAPGPVQLDPGASLVLIRILKPGRYRMTATTTNLADLSNPVPLVSNTFDTP
jgi:hypothetical protein